MILEMISGIVRLRLHAQIVAACRHRRDNDRVVAATFAAVGIGIVADLTAEVVSLAGAIVNQGKIEVGPVIAEVGRDRKLHVRRASRQTEWLGNERWFG